MKQAVTRRKRTEAGSTAGQGTIRTVLTVSREVVDDKTVDVPVEAALFDVEPALVRVSVGVTRNLGNYESLRIDASLTMPCVPERADEVYKQSAERVGGWITQELEYYGVSAPGEEG